MGAGSCLESSVGVKARGSSTLSVSAQSMLTLSTCVPSVAADMTSGHRVVGYVSPATTPTCVTICSGATAFGDWKL